MCFISTNKLNIGKKAQIWYTDLIISLLIFITSLSIYYAYPSNEMDSSMENIVSDAKAVSTYLIGSGYPRNWNASTAVILGLTDGNGRIEQSKLDSLQDIDYSKARRLLNTKYDFFVYIKDKTNCFINFGDYGYGHPSADLEEIGSSDSCNIKGAKNITLNLSDIAPKKLIKIDRLVIYNSTISWMVLNEWE